MNADWLWIGLILGGAGGTIILFVLGAFKLADRADRKARRIMRDLLAESERVVRHGEQHPWVGR
jgi:hypothetical protein